MNKLHAYHMQNHEIWVWVRDLSSRWIVYKSHANHMQNHENWVWVEALPTKWAVYILNVNHMWNCEVWEWVEDISIISVSWLNIYSLVKSWSKVMSSL